MKIDEARTQFIQAFGTFASEWGINRTMAQVHALLLVSPKPKSAEEIMDELQISRGNVNMNVRELIDWGLLRKVVRLGERKEYFEAEKDMWKVVKLIIAQRKKRELEPMLNMLDELAKIEKSGKTEEEQEFVKAVTDIRKLAGDANKTLDRMIKADEHWFFGTFMKLFR